MEKAGELAGSDADYAIKDLYETIATDKCVSSFKLMNNYVL